MDEQSDADGGRSETAEGESSARSADEIDERADSDDTPDAPPADSDDEDGADADETESGADAGDRPDDDGVEADGGSADAKVGDGSADAESDNSSTDTEAELDGKEELEDAEPEPDDEETDGESADSDTTDRVHDPDSPRPYSSSDADQSESAAEAETDAESTEETPEVTPEKGGDPDDAHGPDPPDEGLVGAEEPAEEEYEPEQPTGMAAAQPAEDQEMPLTAHIEEMVHRLAIVCVVLAAVTAVAFPVAGAVVDHLWYAVLPDATPRIYGPLEFLLTKIKVASLAGFVIALPVFVYQSYQFMRPGLYPNERRYYLASVPTSLVLAVIGVAFAYFIILPAIFIYFQQYSEEAATIAFGLAETFNLILIMMGYLAVVFQIPLLVMLGIMMGLTTREWLEGRRLYFWGGFLGVSFIFSPDPTGMAPLMVAVTMIALFEGTLALLRWTGR